MVDTRKLLVIAAFLANGSAHSQPDPSINNQPEPTYVVPLDDSTQFPPVKITAVGYGAKDNYTEHTDGQQSLLAIRAAKDDALRALAEQIYGVWVSGQTTTQAAMVQNDSARVYVNSFVRGARFTQITPLAQGNYEVTAELTFSQQFFECLRTPVRVGCGFQKSPGVLSSASRKQVVIPERERSSDVKTTPSYRFELAPRTDYIFVTPPHELLQNDK